MYTYIYICKARALPKRDTINFRLKWIFKWQITVHHFSHPFGLLKMWYKNHTISYYIYTQTIICIYIYISSNIPSHITYHILLYIILSLLILLSGWWFQPLWKILVKWAYCSHIFWKNEIHVRYHQPILLLILLLYNNRIYVDTILLRSILLLIIIVTYIVYDYS